MRPVEAVYSIPLADVRLYAIDANGNPVGEPVWLAKCFNQVRITERFLEKATMPTGARYPTTHHINETHEIAVESLMDVALTMQRNTYYVLYVLNLQADHLTNLRWVARTYFGVTHRSFESGGRDGNEVVQTQVFNSQFYIQQVGQGATTGLPYTLNIGSE